MLAAGVAGDSRISPVGLSESRASLGILRIGRVPIGTVVAIAALRRCVWRYWWFSETGWRLAVSRWLLVCRQEVHLMGRYEKIPSLFDRPADGFVGAFSGVIVAARRGPHTDRNASAFNRKESSWVKPPAVCLEDQQPQSGSPVQIL